MTQLTFQPALDPYHAVFRVLRLRSILLEIGLLHKDHVRILDFFVLSPFRINEIRLATAHRSYKKLADKYRHLAPYGMQPDPPLLFDRMEPMLLAAFDTLVSTGYMDGQTYERAEIKMTDKPLAYDIAQRISELNAEQSDLMAFIKVLAKEYTLTGPDGLKARSHLLEYRYDAI